MPRRPLRVLMVFLMTGAGPLPFLAGDLHGQCGPGEPVQIAIPPEGAVQELTLEAGTRLLGRVVGVGDPIRFELLSGDVLDIQRSRIRCLRTASGRRRPDGEFWRDDPNATRLFFGPTARSVGSGHGYISVFELIMPFVAVGLGERVTMAGGVPLFLTEAGIEVLYLAPKVEVVRTDWFRGAIGGLGFFARGETGSAGVLYGVGTFGRSSDAAFTVGAGWGYSTDSGIGDVPALLAGFEYRVGHNVKLISENYMVVDEGVGVLVFGPRFFGERLSADVGLGVPVGADEFVAFPVVNFVWNW